MTTKTEPYRPVTNFATDTRTDAQHVDDFIKSATTVHARAVAAELERLRMQVDTQRQRAEIAEKRVLELELDAMGVVP